MAIGRITTKKILDHIKLKKYKKFSVPVKNKNKWYYRCIDFIKKDEFIYENDILSVLGEYCKDNLTFYFSYGNLEELVSHEHSFDIVLERLYEFPETFSIPKDCEEFYSKRELEFLNHLQKKLLKDDLKDIGTFYKKHPLKKEYETYFLEYNYEELRKRNIKKIHGISIKKHKKLYKKNSN